ncbi:AMP-binding protein [uncultured Roseobacter sp.]|uniref:class I adenylate-forming enzyme family protein n=1 Tax=uncultured Roseobacter sp. TaxID=114847 RepID=UPI002612FA70|nr:AMP-binding protein [uncultured Roseobacter sp.]
MNLANWLAQTAALTPDRPALFAGETCVADYQTFFQRALAVAGWLKAQGVQPGDRVALFMSNSPDFLIIFYGVWCAGAVVVPINSKLHGKEAAFIISDAGAAVTFGSGALAEALIQAGVSGRVIDTEKDAFEAVTAHRPLMAVADRAASDLAWLFYTSGTTGRPKGVMITFRMLFAMSLCYALDVDPVLPGDAVLYAAPMSHGAGLYNMMHVRVGARHVCPLSGGFDPAEIFSLSAHFGSVQMFAAPTMVQRMTRHARAHGLSGEGLRTVVYAGGPMYNADIIEATETFGPVFVQIYGQGECPMGITALSRHDVADRTHPDRAARLQSVGRAQAAVEVRIGDQQGMPVAPGSHGEIMVRGDTVMPGYWQNAKATADTLRNGWLMTGDMGFIDDAGYVTMRDRSRDMIITGGSNVYPREVEEVLQTDPGVEEVSVVGRPHAEWGEEVVAFVVGHADPAQLDRLCLARIARFKRPRDYIFVQELPKNNYGKVLKTDLRAILRKG